MAVSTGCMRGENTPCLLLLLAASASPERINMSTDHTALQVFFQLHLSCLAYPGFNKQCAWRGIDQQDTKLSCLLYFNKHQA